MKKIIIITVCFVFIILPTFGKNCKQPKYNWELQQVSSNGSDNIAVYIDKTNVKDIYGFKEYWQKWEFNNEIMIVHSVLDCSTKKSLLLGGIKYVSGKKIIDTEKYNQSNFSKASNSEWTILKDNDVVLNICK